MSKCSKISHMDRDQQPISYPVRLEDGTLDAMVRTAAYAIGQHWFLELAVPEAAAGRYPCGQFMMARCAAASGTRPRPDWSIYLRRPLFLLSARAAADLPGTSVVVLCLPNVQEPGYHWLANLAVGDRVNLLGPYGREVTFTQDAKHLVLTASPACAPLLVPAAEQMLDRGGRVTFIICEENVSKEFLALLPLSIEIQASSERDIWRQHLRNGIRWADVMLICDANLSVQEWADLIGSSRMILDQDFAQILIPAPFVCCSGACMACVVQRTDGSLTRACQHGPVFPLTDLVR